MTGRRFRRLFHRPDAMVVGYDERVLRPEDMRRARDSAPAPLRTMPFRREEPDPGAPVLITLGSLRRREELSALEGLGSERWREVWRLIASGLARGAQPQLRVMVRFDYRRVIVRGDIQTPNPEDVITALAQIPHLAGSVVEAAEALPVEKQLLTARFDPSTGRWRLGVAYGFRGRKWMLRFDVARREWREMSDGSDR